MEDNINRFFKKDRFAHYVGIELLEATKGYAVARLLLSEKHLNGLGSVQGGAIYTLADFTFAAATNSGGLATVGLNTTISFFKAPKGKFITAKAREIHSGNRVCGCDVDVIDEDGTLVAKFSGTGYRINKILNFDTE